MLYKLEHENIIKYYDFFIENNQICTVLEYCEVNLKNQLILFSLIGFKILLGKRFVPLFRGLL